MIPFQFSSLEKNKGSDTTYYKKYAKVALVFSNTHAQLLLLVIYFSNIKRASSFQT